jgi:tetratricopeptide (TPR) repeat protein
MKINWLDICVDAVSEYLDIIYEDNMLEQKFAAITDSAFSVANFADTSHSISDKRRVASLFCSGLGLLLQETYQYRLALDAYKKSLAIKKETGISDRFIEHFNIAKMLNETEDFNEAIKYYTLCIRERQQRSGKHDISLVDYYLEIASCYSQQSDNLKAIQNCLTCIDIISKNKNTNAAHFVYITEVCIVLSEIYLQCGEYREATKYSFRALKTCRTSIEKDDYHYLSQGRIFNINAKIYLRTGDYRKALCWLNKELSIYKGFDNGMEGIADKISDTHNYIGTAYLRQERYEEAIKYYQAVLNFQNDLHTVNSPESALALNNLGFAYGDMEEWEEAFEYYNSALEILLPYFGEEHSYTMLVYFNMAYDYCSMTDYPKALKFIEKVIKYNLDRYGDRTANLADAYWNAARTYHHKQEFEKALDHYKRALKIQKDIYFDYHPDIGETYKNIADVLFDMNSNSAISLENYTRAKDIFEKSLCKNNSRLLPIYERISLLSQQGGDESK